MIDACNINGSGVVFVRMVTVPAKSHPSRNRTESWALAYLARRELTVREVKSTVQWEKWVAQDEKFLAQREKEEGEGRISASVRRSQGGV